MLGNAPGGIDGSGFHGKWECSVTSNGVVVRKCIEHVDIQVDHGGPCVLLYTFFGEYGNMRICVHITIFPSSGRGSVGPGVVAAPPDS